MLGVSDFFHARCVAPPTYKVPLVNTVLYLCHTDHLFHYFFFCFPSGPPYVDCLKLPQSYRRCGVTVEITESAMQAVALVLG